MRDVRGQIAQRFHVASGAGQVQCLDAVTVLLEQFGNLIPDPSVDEPAVNQHEVGHVLPPLLFILIPPPTWPDRGRGCEGPRRWARRGPRRVPRLGPPTHSQPRQPGRLRPPMLLSSLPVHHDRVRRITVSTPGHANGAVEAGHADPTEAPDRPGWALELWKGSGLAVDRFQHRGPSSP